MRRKFLSAMIVLAALALGACQEEPIDELIQDTELNQASDPDQNEDVDKPGGSN